MDGEHGTLGGLAQDDAVSPAGWASAEAVAPHGPTDGVVDRDEAIGELVQFFCHPVDVTLPEAPPGVGVAMAALVVEIPPRQGRRLEGEPVGESFVASGAEDVAVAVERVVVDASGFGFDPRPFDGRAPRVAAEGGELADVVAEVARQARSVVGTGGLAGAFPDGPVGGRGDALDGDRRRSHPLDEGRAGRVVSGG